MYYIVFVNQSGIQEITILMDISGKDIDTTPVLFPTLAELWINLIYADS